MLLGIVGDYFFWIGPRLPGSLHCWHSAAAVFVAISTEYIGIPCGTAPQSATSLIALVTALSSMHYILHKHGVVRSKDFARSASEETQTPCALIQGRLHLVNDNIISRTAFSDNPVHLKPCTYHDQTTACECAVNLYYPRHRRSQNLQLINPYYS